MIVIENNTTARIRCGTCGEFRDAPTDLGAGRAIAVAERTHRPYYPVHSRYTCSCGEVTLIVIEPPDPFPRRAENAAKRRAEIVTTGMRVISAVAVYDPRTGENPMTTWSGKTKTVVLTNAPVDCLRFGIGSVLVGPDSELVDPPAELSRDDARAFVLDRRGITLTIFDDHTPRWPAP